MLQQQGKGVVTIEGMVYPPGAVQAFLATLFFYIFVIGMLLMVIGDTVFTRLAYAPGIRLVAWMRENQMAVIITLVACNWLSSQMLATGAFEVYYNDEEVFSAIKSGGLPNAQMLLTELHQRQALAASAAAARALPNNAM